MVLTRSMMESKRKTLSSQSLVCESKRNKLDLEDDSRLNDFPDAVLSHILSFLSTKEVVKTSVLSRRWRCIWTYSLPNLDFQEKTWEFSRHDPQEEVTIFYGSDWKTKGQPIKENRKHFIKFVDRVLRFHDLPRIQKFSLSCDVKNDVHLIKKWISSAVTLNAQEFNIYLDKINVFGQHVFPDCLFSSRTIQVLKLETDFGIVVPPRVCLPYLKVLNLKNITFPDYYSANLLFASPSLEELVINNCDLEDGLRDDYELIISAPKLLSLTIDERRFATHVQRYRARQSIRISAPALEICNFRGEFIKEYRLSSSSSIFKATVGFHNSRDSIHLSHFNEVLKSLHSVKHLELSSAVARSLHRAMLPVFKNLISLEISEESVNLYSKGLKSILNKCPSLETLRFPWGISCPFKSKFFSFFSLTLKNIIIGGYRGHSTELFAMEILLTPANLEILEISFAENLERREEIENVLSAIPRGSKSCKLCFKWPI